MMHSKAMLFLLVMGIGLSLQGCANTSTKKIMSPELQLINQYSSEYFVGIGKGIAGDERTALKIARAAALGELSTNVKVFITNRLEVQSAEQDGSYTESVSQHITEIGNAVVRSPEYEIISSGVNKASGQFEVKVLAKKRMQDHFEEAARTIAMDDISDIMEFLNGK